MKYGMRFSFFKMKTGVVAFYIIHLGRGELVISTDIALAMSLSNSSSAGVGPALFAFASPE